MPLNEYFEDLMRRRQAIVARAHQARLDHKTSNGKKVPRPLNEMGYLSLPKANFESMVRKAQSPEDIQTLIDAYMNFLGHRNLIPQTIIDKLMLKAIEVDGADKTFDFMKHHAELLYHPSPSVIQAFTDHLAQKGYESLKTWFQSAIKGRYLMVHPEGWHQFMID